MRIIALPLTSAVRGPYHASDDTSDSRPLVYYHFQLPPPPKDRKVGWMGWATGKAAGVWAKFGQAPKKNWKFKIYHYGEHLVDRIDFEELALKGLDPSMGPKLTQLRDSQEDADAKKHAIIPLVHPKFFGSSPLTHLENLLAKRKPRHLKGFWTWMLISPLTAPFMLVQVAYKASDYLQSMLERGAIVPQIDVNLDEIYIAHSPPRPLAPASTLSPSEILSREITPKVENGAQRSGPGATTTTPGDSSSSKKRVILTPDAVPPILSLFGLPSSAATDIHRAIEQAGVRLKKGVYK
ncbi:hypothetical protein EW146_g3833 [Bondarzewia mesenterica]|uniref:Uncharacterized protein n=1 Tax=Bondarzewia mesenterica TaxID=1095465 RepID=A0A4S4LY53_9AGAM|nr:hypothetical protein EW146_g3833 [Bondarzewia mesenterica]